MNTKQKSDGFDVLLLLVVVIVMAVAMFLMGGCGTANGVCKDGKFLFTVLDNITTPLTEKEADTQRKMEEAAQVRRQKRAMDILEYQQRKDKATAETYGKASSDANNQ